MKRRIVPLFALLASPLLLLASPSVAYADPPHGQPPRSDVAAAQALFYEARDLMRHGKFAEACPKLEESMRLDPGLGTQFNLADCHEHIGRVTTAWTGFLGVAAQSKSTNQPEREKLARKRATELEPRLPKLVVDVSNAPLGLEVRRDGVAVGTAIWGMAVPVDPGPHEITATAPGKEPWRTTVTTAEGKTVHAVVPRELPDAHVAAVAAPVVTPAVTAPSRSEPAPIASGIGASGAVMSASAAPPSDFPPPVVEGAGGTQRAVGWVVAGVGVVGLGLGAGFGISSIGKRNDSRSHCVGDRCDVDGVRLRDDAIRAGNIATVSTIVGAAAAVSGLIIVLTAPKNERASDRAGKVRAIPTVATNGGGLTLVGVFE